MPKSTAQKLASKEETTPSEIGFSLISNQKLMAIYTSLLRCRMVIERASNLFAEGQLSRDLRASAGREASAAAIVVDLKPEDAVSLANGDIMPAFTKGLSLESIFRALSARPTSPHSRDAMLNGNGQKLLRISPSSDVDSQLDAIFKFAVAAKQSRRGDITIAFFDASASEKQLSEAIALAGAKLLPIVFVRFTGRAEPESSKTAFSGGRSALGALIDGSPAIVVDGSDAVALYRVSFEAIARARQHRGPTVVECSMSIPVNPATETKNSIYKTNEPLGMDPVVNMENYLKGKGIWNEEAKRAMVAGFERELNLATSFLFN
jgi:pyruvate dehydrogenase E1 component alpha subunit